MRKTQEKILEKARKNNYSPSTLTILESDLPVSLLHDIYICLGNHKNEDIEKDQLLYLINLPYIHAWGLNYSQNTINEIYNDVMIIEQSPDKKELYDLYFYGMTPSLSLDTCLYIVDRCNSESLSVTDFRDCLYDLLDKEPGWKNIPAYFDKVDDMVIEKVISLLKYKRNIDASNISYRCLASFFDNNFSNDFLNKYQFSPKIIKAKLFKQNYPQFYKSLLDNYKKEHAINSESEIEELLSFSNVLRNHRIWIKEPDKIKEMEEFINFAQKKSNSLQDMYFSLSGRPVQLIINLNYKSFTLDIKYGDYYYTRYDSYKNTFEIACGKKQSKYNRIVHLLFFYDDGGVYYNPTKQFQKWVPISFRKFDEYLNKGCSSLSVLFNEYINQRLEEKKYIWKDLKLYLKTGLYAYTIFPPITLKEINSYHNLDELMKHKYKHADFVNWNKCNLAWGYLLMKLFPQVTIESKNMLLNMKYDYLSDNPMVKNVQSFMYDFILDYLDPSSYPVVNGKKIDREHMFIIVSDYVRSCKTTKRKINLCFTSGKKLKEAHDDMQVIILSKYTPKIKIKRNSKFNNLKKLLPDDFEQIKTKKRIIEEGVKMHHCVASYASLVNSDTCAIYSLVYEDNRYTIEFRSNKKGYFVRQLHGVCDSDAPKEVWNYVNSFIA